MGLRPWSNSVPAARRDIKCNFEKSNPALNVQFCRGTGDDDYVPGTRCECRQGRNPWGFEGHPHASHCPQPPASAAAPHSLKCQYDPGIPWLRSLCQRHCQVGARQPHPPTYPPKPRGPSVTWWERLPSPLAGSGPPLDSLRSSVTCAFPGTWAGPSTEPRRG